MDECSSFHARCNEQGVTTRALQRHRTSNAPTAPPRAPHPPLNINDLKLLLVRAPRHTPQHQQAPPERGQSPSSVIHICACMWSLGRIGDVLVRNSAARLVAPACWRRKSDFPGWRLHRVVLSFTCQSDADHAACCGVTPCECSRIVIGHFFMKGSCTEIWQR